MSLDPAALEAARRLVAQQPPLSPAALDRIRPLWIPTYRRVAQEQAAQTETPQLPTAA